MLSTIYPEEAAEQIVDVIFGRDDLESSLRTFFHLHPASSEHTSNLLEILQTEAALLRSQIGQATSPDRESLRLARRYASACSLIADLSQKGSINTGIPSKGRGTRAALVAFAQQSVDAASDGIADITIAGSKRPAGLPTVSSLGQIKVTRPAALPPDGSVYAQGSSSPALPIASSSSSSGNSIDTLHAASVNSLKSLRDKLVARSSKNNHFADLPASKAAAGVGLSDSSSSQEADFDRAQRLEALRIARDRALSLKSELECAEREVQEFTQKLNSPRTQSLQSEPNEQAPERAPLTTPRKNMKFGSEHASPNHALMLSPSADESQALALRSQLAELEARINAEKALATASSEEQLKNQVANLRLELDMMRKAACSPTVNPSNITLAKESDRIPITGSPTAGSYLPWRDGVEVSVVSSSGRAEEVVAFMSQINADANPLDLALSCPPQLKSLDAKFACSLRAALANAGLPGERVLLKVQENGAMKFSGRAIQRLTDIEFGYLSQNSIAVSYAAYQRLRLSGNSWSSLETFLNQLDQLLIRLKNSPEYPSNTSLMTLLEDQVEQQLTFTHAAFAAYRQKELDGASPLAVELISLLKQRCEKQREKTLRDAAIRTLPIKQRGKDDKNKNTDDKQTKETTSQQSNVTVAPANAKPDKTDFCQLFQIKKCKHQDNPEACRYIHKFNKEAKKKAEERDAKWAEKNKQTGDKSSKPSTAKGGANKKINVPCKFYAEGKCTSTNCMFLHAAAGVPTGVANISACTCIKPFQKSALAAPALSSKESVVPLLPVTVGSNLVLDSGAGIHLLNPKDASASIAIHDAPSVKLDTANGVICSDLAAQIQVPLGTGQPINAEVRILRNSPSVLALGKLCCESGYAFVWGPFTDPLLFSPCGQVYRVPQHQFVPVLNQVEQLSSDDAITRIQRVIAMLDAPVVTLPAALKEVPSIEQQYETFVSLKLPSDRLLIECCTDSESQFGLQAHVHGFYVIRICQQHDLHDSTTEALIASIIAQNPGCHIHGSLPCTPWSRFQNLCCHMSSDTKAYKFRLKRQRQASLRLVAAYGRLSKSIPDIGGSASFEWPSTAKDGHDNPFVVKTKTQSKLVHTAIVAACAVNLNSPVSGLPFGKSWRFDCSSKFVADSLAPLQCTKDHQHAPTQGSDTARTAHYSATLDDAYFQGLQAHINAKGVLQPMPVMPAVVEEVVPADDENKISLNDKLKRVAHSTEHLMTHLPANPFCEFCQSGKHRRAPHRAKHEAPARADKFGDKLYADHVFASRAAPGYDGSTCVFITLDSATSIPAAYPASSKSAAEVEKALRHNFGRHIAAHCTVASDSALEISAACNAIGVIHLGTTPDDSETHGIQERHNQELLRMTRTTLLAAGFAPEFWPLAIQHAAVSIAICGSPSPFERKTTKALKACLYRLEHKCPGHLHLALIASLKLQENQHFS